ncbi:MAG TPA: dihydrolipoyllysine-residue acetyltransferase [Gammaproteobacteria bacterium]
MADLKEITVPDIGDFDAVEVIEVLIAPGDSVNAEDSLITVESDKASMEIPSPESGVIREVKVKVGDKISQGSVIVLMEPAGNAAAPQPEQKTATAKTPEPAPQKTKPEAAPSATVEPKKPEAAPSAPAASEDKQVRVPDIGDFDSIPVIEVLVSPGDKVSPEDPLITLESDKATMEIPSPGAGTIKELLVKVGDKVSKETPILVMTTAGAPAPIQSSQAAPETRPQPESKPAPSATQTDDGQRPAPLPPVNETGFGKAHASPAVRKFARELGADIGRIQGTGPKGRIQKEDVQAYIKRILTSGAGASAGAAGGLQVAELPEVDFAAFGDIETQPLSKINKLTGKYTHRSWVQIPHVTQFDEADITELEAFRKQLSAEYKDKGVKITLIAFLLKAVVAAMREYPRFNSSLDSSGENLILKKYFHIGVAVDTPDGLVVPVIRDVDQKGIVELAGEIVDIAKRAREKKIKPSEMQGGCFTISSLGGVGGTAFTPIINQREVAILGVSRSSMKPVYEDGQFIPRLMLPLSLSYDHRVIDGVMGARFTNYLSQVLSDVKRLLL